MRPLDVVTVGSQIVDVAESPQRLGARVVVRHAVSDEPCDAPLDVKRDLFVEVSREPVLRGRKPKDAPDAARGDGMHGQVASRILPTALAYRRHVAVSARSCARPRGVSE